MKTLPDDSKVRKHYPIASGCIAYFPAALAGVAKHSFIGGAKYNNGALLWLRYMSADHLDCIGRHLLDLQDLLALRERGVTEFTMPIWNFETKREEQKTVPIEEAILIEANAQAWRALAVSQELHEKLAGAPMCPAGVLEPPALPVPTPLPQVRVHSYTDGKKVAVIKAIREIGGYTLKDACDMVQGVYPFTVDSRIAITNARRILTEAGAHIE
jgi:ribosomal protein L7/L12